MTVLLVSGERLHHHTVVCGVVKSEGHNNFPMTPAKNRTFYTSFNGKADHISLFDNMAM